MQRRAASRSAFRSALQFQSRFYHRYCVYDLAGGRSLVKPAECPFVHDFLGSVRSVRFVAHDMASTQSRTFWTTYTDYVKTLARADPSFAWLAYFFSQTPLSSNSGGQLNVLESHNDTLKEYACPLEDLGISPKAGTTRIVVFSYEEAWGIRREVLDQVALALNLPPYFLWQHLEYPGHPGENAFPGSPGVPHYTRPSAAASEVMSLEIGWTSFFHMSAMIASPATISMGSVGRSFT